MVAPALAGREEGLPMNTKLELVSDRGGDGRDTPQVEAAHEPEMRLIARRGRSRIARAWRELRADERGAITAEYAIVLMARV